MGKAVNQATKNKTFSVDARTVLQLGRQSIKDHTTAVLELVKNSYDADATLVEIQISRNGGPFIRIGDNGSGMSESDLDNKWLRIGYSEKLQSRISDTQRRRTGEKGVGRISADRLGASLHIASKARGSDPVELWIDWDRFDVDGKELGTIPIETRVGQVVPIPRLEGHPIVTGTELTISRLRQDWSAEDLKALHDELAVLTPPFGKVTDFAIQLESDIDNEYQGKVTSPFFELAEIELRAELLGKTVQYEIHDRIGTPKPKLAFKGELAWDQLTSRARPPIEKPRVGPLSLLLLLYPRKAEILSGTEFRLSDLRAFLNRNAGVKIYRDNVRVRPYGDPESPEGDWLGLAERRSREPAGVARKTYTVAANQLVGAVFVSRDRNPQLADSASREGLIHGEAFRDLRAFVIGCLGLLEAHRHTAYQERAPKEAPKDPLEEVAAAKSELKTLRSDLRTIRKSVPASMARNVDRAIDQLAIVGRRFSATESAVQEMLAESGVLRGLATLGIAASIFGHETQSAIAAFLGSTRLTRELLLDRPPSVDIALEEIDKAIHSATQVGAWGSFALARVRRDKRRRRKLDVKKSIERLIADLQPAYAAAQIEMSAHLQSVLTKTFEMDLEAVVLNLLTNAYVACLQRKRRVVRLELCERERNGTPGFSLIVADSGPGVPKQLRDKVWTPLFTTHTDRHGKQTGTGLGLTIVRSIVDELGGATELDSDPELKGARFAIWFPKR